MTMLHASVYRKERVWGYTLFLASVLFNTGMLQCRGTLFCLYMRGMEEREGTLFLASVSNNTGMLQCRGICRTVYYFDE